MALARPLPPLWQTLLPALSGPVRPIASVPFLQRFSQPFASPTSPLAALTIPWSLPSIPSLADIWNGILNAVPKKKTSFRKKRQRFLAGKGLKDITSLNRCSACGRVKRMHILCPYCVDAIKTTIFGQIHWATRLPTKKQARQLAHEERELNKQKRRWEPDPAVEERKQVLKHKGWSR